MAIPRRPPRWPLRAALLAALIATSCSSAGRRDAKSTSTLPTPPPTLAAPTSTTEPAPQFAASPYVWERSTAPVLDIGGGATTTISAVLAPTLSAPWMIIGTKESAGTTPTATIWTSPDGKSWSGSDLQPGGAPSRAMGVAQFRGATVVVGALGEGADEQAAAWWSPQPGAPFTAVSVPLSDGASAMSTVTQGALGLFAIGTVDGRFAMWSSTNGRQWGELPSAEKTITSEPGARVNALIADGDDVYAAGSIQSGPGTAAAVWWTADGLHWRMVSTAANAFAGAGWRVIYSIAPLQTGLVAVGAINTGIGWSPASWISPDGQSWSQASTDFAAPTPRGPTPAATGTAALAVSGIATFAGITSVVAVGGGPSGEGLWKSADGLHWTADPLPGPTANSTAWRPTLVGATYNAIVLADGDPGQPHVLTNGPAGWAEPSSDPAVFGPVRPSAVPERLEETPAGLVLEVALVSPPQAIGTASIADRYFTSADGSSWNPATASSMPGSPPSRPAPGALAVQTASGSWVAVGEAATGYPQSWLSRTGSSWTAEGPLDAATSGARPEATVSALCAPPAGTAPGYPLSGVVAVGSSVEANGNTTNPTTGHSAAAWVLTAPGTTWKRSPVSPGPAQGGDENMAGCLTTPAGLVAFGGTTGSGGASVPGLWRSANGTAWARASVSAFSPGVPGPLSDLAAASTDWLAVANPAMLVVPTSTLPGPTPTMENGMIALWSSTDSGSTWQRVDLSIAPWPGIEQSQVDLAGFSGTAPIVVGALDGRLTVWTGAPAGTAVLTP